MTLHLEMQTESETAVTTGPLQPATQGSQDVAVQSDYPESHKIVMADPILAQAAAIAAIPGLNEGMFTKLMEWQAQERAEQARERYYDALNKCQHEIAPVARTTENKQIGNFFAKLEAVDAAIRPIYTAYGFAVTYNTIPPLTPGHVRVDCAVSLGRHTEHFYREAPPDTLGPKGTPTKTALHGGGSTETFLKRYAVCGAFNVVFRSLTDDDGVRGGMSFITDDQVDQLRSMLSETKRTEEGFLFRLASDHEGNPVKTFDQVEAKDFLRVSNTLQLIIQQERGRANEDHS